MGTPVSFNGNTYVVPAVGERQWGKNVSNYLIALGNNALAKAGGNFTLTGDVNFGASYGLLVKYLKSVSVNVSTTGVIRLANDEGIGFRNAANSADKILKVNGSDQLEYDGSRVATVADTLAAFASTSSAQLRSVISDETGTGLLVFGVGPSLSAPVIADYIEFADGSDPSTPASGRTRIYTKNKKGYQIDSDGLVKLLGGGSGGGGKNYNSNPDDANANWTASNTGIAVSTETNASNLPENSTKTTAIKILRASGSDYVRIRFTLDVVDYGRSLPIQWLQKYGGAAGDYTLEVYSNTASDYSGTYTNLNARISSIPSGNGVFTSDFMASNASAPYIEIRIKGVAGTTALYLSGVKIGDYTLGTQVPIAGPFPLIPTTTQGFGTISNNTLQYRMINGFMHISGRFQAGTTTSSEARLGLGFTIGTYNGQSIVAIAGKWSRNVATASNTKQGVVIAQSGLTYLNFSLDDYTTANSPGVPQNGDAVLSSNNFMYFDGEIVIPIAEWAGQSLLTNGQGNGVEYASNNGSGGNSANTNYTTGSVSGPAGSAFPDAAISGTSATTLTGYDVTFPTAIQDSDKILLEINAGGSGGWVPVGQGNPGIAAGLYAGSVRVGMYWQQISTTTIRVFFGNAGRLMSSTWGTGQGNWGSDVSNWKWRASKAKPTSPAGILKASATDYGVSAPRKGQTSLTVTGTGWTTIRAVGIYYQDQDGNHRLKFNIAGTCSSTTRTTYQVVISGITTKNISSFTQAVTAANNSNVANQASIAPNDSTITIEHASTTTSAYRLSGDVELDSKPSWA